ncbi:MAG: xenobiotic reductase B [Prevotella sp.]|nr:xenobiotic reductase B [Prevotella sp.]
MCRYEDIEEWKLSNGKTIKEINNAVHDEVERIYLDAWAKGVSVPYFDDRGNIFLANPDGSDDAVKLNKLKRSSCCL